MTSVPATHPDLLASLTRSVTEGMPSTIAELATLVRTASVSWDGFDPETVVRSADAVAALATDLGVFDSVQIARAPKAGTDDLGQPAVLATRAAKNGRPTIMLYAHHDVQPPGDDSGWDSPPFEPTVRGDRLYGRGAADDKAGVMAHMAAIRTLVEVAGSDFDLGLVLFIEGEEEFGSKSFGNFLQQHRAELEADVIVVADSNNWTTEIPALTVGLRGNVTFKLTVETLEHASHSGMFGGAVPDAMLAGIRLLSTLHDDAGSVAVAGLVGRDTDTPPYDEAQLRLETGLLDGVSPIGTGSILDRIWSKPAITVTGIDAPTVVAASNTLAPSVSVKVSVRVAPGQPAEEALAAIEAHIATHTPFGARVTMSDVDLGDPFLVDTAGWGVAEAKRAMAEAWDAEPVEAGIGGSIPFISELTEVFPEAQILVTGVEDPDSRAHSPNESLHLGVFRKAVLTEAILLARLNERA
ncbi:dipeptidase [Marisediminicola sp. LYQ134]|uniref:dipeptidase n=1 Tax=Marisediminicola sp. LYQ134 TaxID=3391061 RepID=UPI0039838A01